MDKKNSDDLVYSKVLIQKVVEHKDMFGGSRQQNGFAAYAA